MNDPLWNEVKHLHSGQAVQDVKWRRVAYLGFRELRRDSRSAKPLSEDPVLIWFEALKYYNKNIFYDQKILV